MNRLFFTLTLLFCLVSPSFCRDFGEKPLEPEAQAKLDALVEKLSDPSIKKREKTIGEILKFGDRAIETLQKAQSHPDFTVSECAKYCLSMLARGLIRSDDSPRVQIVLKQYDSCQAVQKSVLILCLSQIPAEESLVPLMRILMHEKEATAARFSALAVLWALPYTQPVPQFPMPVPESKNFPNPEEWSSQNEQNRTKRQEMLEKLREYLASEPVCTEGKRFLERLLELEKASQAENADASQFEETFQSLYDELNSEDPVILTFLHDFLYLSADLLTQNGHAKEAKDFFLSQTALGLTGFGKAHFQISNERTLTLDYRVLLLQRLVQRGHWEFVPQEIALLNKAISDSEKKRFLKEFNLLLNTIGEFDLSREYSQNVKRLNFLRIQKTTEQEEEDEESIRMNQQIAQFQALDACMKKDYDKAKEVLVKILEAKGEPDVDLLILARKIAVFTKDSEWLEALDKRINEILDQTEKSIKSGAQNILTSNQMNTYAWLAANTDRKLDEALEYAKEAVRLLPNSPGIQDTLATVYFVRGEYEKAFEIQTQAVEQSSMQKELWVNLANLTNLERFIQYQDSKMELWMNLERIRVYLNEKKSEKVETTP